MRFGRFIRFLALAAVAAVPTACAAAPAPPATSEGAAPTQTPAVRAELVSVPLTVPDEMREGELEQARTVLVPRGWSMSVIARTGNARLMAWTPDGRLLVSRPMHGAVDILTPNGAGPATSATLLEGMEEPHGLAFDGSTLYVAESSRINAYDYADGRVTNRRVLVDGLPNARTAGEGGQYGHPLKTVVVGPDRAIYFSVASNGNASPEDREKNPERAAIYRIPPGGGAPEVFARGVRNGTGLAVAPDGAVWTAVNHRDNIQYPYDTPYGDDQSARRGAVIQAYVNDHPAEPLAKLTPGRELGWPYCNPDPDVEPGVAGTALDYSDMRFVADVETNPDGTKMDCAALAPVEQGMPAHAAPLGMAFVTLPAPFGEGALIGLNGSWNREPPLAPEVAFFPYLDGKMGDQVTLVSGFQLPDGKRWGRPVAATVGPDGAVYITDASAPAVYRLAPPGI
ncbi:PQQ-dependent sugar dehydrogenase [Pseudonocardia thermophila]|uniref:PQQ-dependent sugar dehydrogenase n=1 Tax=Pseudonocardia thermophila TaxID=1848 RepID=UPI00248E2E54|nr:gluconolaconase [Pseudonocardia thermophila]